MTTARARSTESSGGERDQSSKRHRPGGPRRPVGPVAPSLQMKPAVVGAAGDAFEREADHAARKVVQGKDAAMPELTPVSPQALQRLVQVPVVSEDEVKEGGGVAQALFDEEEEPVAATSTHADSDTDQAPVQAKAVDSSGPRAVDVPRPGAGAALAPETKSRLESGLGADLGGVRVHDDHSARSTADRMGAKAFTHGSDISLGSGQCADDLGLMAHEAAHVIQQAGGSGSLAQRDPASGGSTTASPSPAAGAPTLTQKTWPDGSAIDTTTTPKKTVTLATLSVPATKKDATAAKLPTGVEIGLPRETKQLAKWKKQLKGAAGDAATKVLAKPEVAATKDTDGNYYLVNEKAAKQPVIVTGESLGDLALRPTWDRDGMPTRFHVDHRVEYQLGGADDESNYWLLEEQANMSSGSTIANQLAGSLNTVFHKAKAEGVANVPADVGSARGGAWAYSVSAISPKALPVQGRENSNWTYQEVQEGKPVLEHLRAMTDAEMVKAGGTKDKMVVLFMGPMGGLRTEIKWDADPPGGVQKIDGWFHLGNKAPGKTNNNFHLTELTFTASQVGEAKRVLLKEAKGVLFEKGVINQDVTTLKIETRERIPWAGFLDKQAFLNEARSVLTFDGLSPIELEEMDLAAGRGLVARGRLMPTVPLIDRVPIGVVIDGNDVYLSKLFTADDFTFPGPIKVGVCSLELRFGLKGFQILGEANFEVQGLGTGRVYAAAGASTEDVSFALGGEFDFLSDLFEPARVELWYKDNELGGKGVLGVKEGKVKGLKSANITAEFGEEGFTAHGTFATTIPGVESGTLAFAYKEDGTVELGGTLNLGSKVPGISGGTVEAQLVRNPEGGWKVYGKIAAVPSIPGVASQITGLYDDGAILVEATVAYALGMAAGQFTIGLSNKPIDPATGKPAGEPGKELAAYGGGQVALTLAPWLRATAGLTLLPSGEIEVSGEIGLPAALEIFSRKSLDKELFKVGIDIPIIGTSVAGQNVGIFANIAGGAQLLAFFGPAELRDLKLGIKWNPDHQDQTTVTGHAALNLPAGAGIRLSISAALGAGIPVVSARMGLEIGGLLGIEAVVGAAVDINWTPTAGLVIDAVAKASAEPVFKFDITGFLRVDLDLLLETINLYEKKWQLASFEYGSGLKFGMSLPIHYQDGKPFEPSLADVQFELPNIDPKALLAGLVDTVT